MTDGVRRVVGLAVVGVLAGTAQARAEGIFTPWFGVVTIPDAGDDGSSRNRPTYGVTVGSYGTIAGFELDFGVTPDFFGDADLLGTNNVVTLMGNLVIGPSLGRVRPYVLGGAGLLRSRIDGTGDFFDISSNDFGVSAGGGIMAFVTRSVGFRGDFRYFRNISSDGERGPIGLDLGEFDFWRLSGGLAIGF